MFSMPKQPTLQSRREMCQRPDDNHVMYQNWDDLLFLHWEVNPDMLAATLPDGLYLDTYGGRAFLGVVPFYMNKVRPRYCPSVPGISYFLEMNLRTYVHDEKGCPGVWFYSLDANQALAVAVARQFFKLPYQHAEMRAERKDGGWVHYRSRRAWTQVECEFLYRGAEEPMAAEEGSLEYFLAERYLLYTVLNGEIYSGRVYHTPYPLARAEVECYSDRLFLLNGFDSPGRPPDLSHYSAGVQVEIFPLRRHSL